MNNNINEFTRYIHVSLYVRVCLFQIGSLNE